MLVAAGLVGALVAVPVSVRAVRAVPQPAAAAAAAGLDATRPVSFHGLTVRVPRGWPDNAVQCGVPLRDTVVFPGPIKACLLPHPPVVSVVRLEPLRGLSADDPGPGRPPRPRTTRRLADGRTQVVLREAALDAQVIITSPHAALAQQIAASLRRTPVDFAGCADRPARLRAPGLTTPQRPGADRVLLPGRPVAAGVCRYDAGWLVQSARLTGTPLANLVGVLDGLPHGSSRLVPGSFDPATTCAEERGGGVVVHARYPDGQPLTVWVDLDGCDELGASNGTVHAQRHDPLPRLVEQLVGGSGWGPVTGQ